MQEPKKSCSLSHVMLMHLRTVWGSEHYWILLIELISGLCHPVLKAWLWSHALLLFDFVDGGQWNMCSASHRNMAMPLHCSETHLGLCHQGWFRIWMLNVAPPGASFDLSCLFWLLALRRGAWALWSSTLSNTDKPITAIAWAVRLLWLLLKFHTDSQTLDISWDLGTIALILWTGCCKLLTVHLQ